VSPVPPGVLEAPNEDLSDRVAQLEEVDRPPCVLAWVLRDVQGGGGGGEDPGRMPGERLLLHRSSPPICLSIGGRHTVSEIGCRDSG